MLAPLTEPFLASDRDVRTISVIGASRPNHSWIGTPFTNKDILSRDDALSTVQSDARKLDKLDTSVQRSSTNKRNTAPLRVEEGIPRNIFPEIVK